MTSEDELIKRFGRERVESFTNSPHAQLLKTIATITGEELKKRDRKITAFENELEEAKADLAQVQMDADRLRGRVVQLESVIMKDLQPR